MAPIAALSEMVSTMVRPSISIRESRISSAGTTYSVAFRTSKMVALGPLTSRLSTKASSTSIRGWVYWSHFTVQPFSRIMSSKMIP